MISASDYLYDKLGWYFHPKPGCDWMSAAIFKSQRGVATSLRGPGKPSFLVSDEAVWVQTKFAVPDGVRLPPHVHWGCEGLVEQAVQLSSHLDRWLFVQLSNVGPGDWLPRRAINVRLADSYVLYFDSGREVVSWSPAFVQAVAEAFAPLGSPDPKRVFDLLDKEVSGQPIAEHEAAVARKLYMLFRRYAPEMMVNGPQRRPLRIALSALII